MLKTLGVMVLILAPGSVSAEQYLSFGRAAVISGGSTIDACIEQYCIPGLVDHGFSGLGYEIGVGQRWHIGDMRFGIGLAYLDGPFSGIERYGNDRFGLAFQTTIERVVSFRFELGFEISERLSIFGFGGPAALEGAVAAEAYAREERVGQGSAGWMLGARYGVGARYDFDGPWSAYGEISRIQAKGRYERTQRILDRDIDGRLDGDFTLDLITIGLERTF